MSHDASPPSARAAQWLGVVLKGKWRLDTLIGVGGMASVFAATHRNGSRVAIKILNPEYAAQPEFVERFKREGYVANMISHPSSVTVLDDDSEYGCAFLVMELLSGHSLERYTRRNGPRLPLANILHVSEQVLDLLAVAHARGILHRDIKPANIHVTAEGTVKVLDFGIARLAQAMDDVAPTQTGAALGTPSYMPPEQARGRWNMVDPRTDMWALGATMHALIVGERPRRADTVQEEMLLAMTTPLHLIRDLAPATPQPVVAFLERTTAFEMEARWPDTVTMQHALRQVVLAVHSNARASGSASSGAAPGPTLNPEPGSRSGPRLDTARIMVPPARALIERSERDPMTLQATENTARPTMGSKNPRALLAVGAAALALVVTVGAVVVTSSRAPETASEPRKVAAAAALPPLSSSPSAPRPPLPPSPLARPASPAATPVPTSTEAPTSAPPAEPATPAESSDVARPVSPVAEPTVTPVVEIDTAARPGPAASVTTPPSTPVPVSTTHHPSKPAQGRLPNTSSPLFDERF